MKDNSQPDDGTEARARVFPTRSWQTSSFRLSDFTGLDRSAVYVVIEFVFEAGSAQQVVDFRNIRIA